MNAKSASYEGLAQALSFVLTARGIPMIYYGDEIGMPGGGDPDNRRDFPGGWPEDPRNAFDTAGRTASEQGLFTHLQRLMQLRAGSDSLRRGRMVDLLVEDRAYAFARVTAASRMVVVFNNGAESATLRIPLNGTGIVDGVALADCYGTAPPAQVRNGAVEVQLAAHSVAIYR